MPKYSKWIQVSVWCKNAESILHIRDHILKEGETDCVKFVAKRMKYAVFTRIDLQKRKTEMKMKEIEERERNLKLLREMI